MTKINDQQIDGWIYSNLQSFIARCQHQKLFLQGFHVTFAKVNLDDLHCKVGQEREC